MAAAKDDNMEITKDTKLADLIAQYPWLKAEMAKVNEKFKMLNTPVGKIMLGKATIAEMSKKSGMEVEAFVFFMKKDMSPRLQKSLLGFASGVMIAAWLTPILPYMLAFAAGAMCYVVVEELIPEASSGEHSNLSTIGFAIGFVLMMVFDVVMG